MNLFLQTRSLTQRAEDHLTCFVAAALETDSQFRAAYGAVILSPLATPSSPATIAGIATQVSYDGYDCRPDMELRLSDGRVVLCEHKLEAAETEAASQTGEPLGQLERYLALPVDAVAYFRISMVSLTAAVLAHPRYLRPANGNAHFLGSSGSRVGKLRAETERLPSGNDRFR
ncbi:MAG: hypothetical protein ACYC7F_02070, partial [Gemmatimonadaceae bacterium]